MADRHDDREIWVREFTEASAHKFRDQVLTMAERGGDEILIPIYIDSYGGYVDSLAKMIETMDSLPNRFATIASGKAMSCGAILFSHGDVRWCGPYTRIMIHNIHSGTWGDAYDKEQASKETMRMQQVFMGLLAKNCQISYTELEAKIKESISSKEIWLDCDSAVEFGIADHIGCPLFRYQTTTLAMETPEKVRLTDEEKGVERPRKKTESKTTQRKTTKKSKVRRKTRG